MSHVAVIGLKQRPLGRAQTGPGPRPHPHGRHAHVPVEGGHGVIRGAGDVIRVVCDVIRLEVHQIGHGPVPIEPHLRQRGRRRHACLSPTAGLAHTHAHGSWISRKYYNTVDQGTGYICIISGNYGAQQVYQFKLDRLGS